MSTHQLESSPQSTGIENGSADGTGAPALYHPESPGISLPTGGGAIRGIDEQFKVNAANGSASFSIPVPVSPARQGFSPSLSLSYSSNDGNGPFGLGWSLVLPSITRRTNHKLPAYQDVIGSDVFSLGGVDDLVPFLVNEPTGWQPEIDNRTEYSVGYQVRRYRPRIEGSHSRIELWQDLSTGVLHWRVTSPTNVTTLYGYTAQARVADPLDPLRVFEWLPEKSCDVTGNCIEYRYKPENLSRVPNDTHELNRIAGRAPFTNRYLKRVLYGNRRPVDLRRDGPDFHSQEYLFQTVFDYGDHDPDLPVTNDSIDWGIREDPFSTYRAGFEIRTWRRCSRVLLFHQFDELGSEPKLVRSLELDYEVEGGTSFLTSAVMRGHITPTFPEDGQQDTRLPPMTFRYQEHAWNREVQTLGSGAMENLPVGVNFTSYQWVDLYREGLSGVLCEQAGQMYYKRNLGGGMFSRLTPIPQSPSLPGLENGSWLADNLEGDGELSLVSRTSPAPGYYKSDRVGGWRNFQPFESFPNAAIDDANARLVDLDGDGRAEILITEETLLRWYPSAGEKGFEAAHIHPMPADENDGPRVLFSSSGERIVLVDAAGDGLQDIMRVRNGDVAYWPNLGHGRFGAKVTMTDSPLFDHPDQFDANRLLFADIDGSGTIDVAYAGRDSISAWFNYQGNGWSVKKEITNPFPHQDSSSQLAMFDLFGTGTSCLVWSSPLPAQRNQPLRYVDLMAGVKPHVMVGYANNMGREVALSYTPSTRFYLDDQARGEPWVTRLHFPVQCLSKVETVDYVSGHRYAQAYSYHHGYFDHAEREFRGFGRVDQVDSEDFEHFALVDATNVVEGSLRQAPVLTRTWFHTGAFIDIDTILDHYSDEYFVNTEFPTHKLPRPRVPENLSTSEWREALRACKGITLRTETYGLDDDPMQDTPYSVVEYTADIRLLQPRSNNRSSCFEVLATESISYQYDRVAADPRVSHSMVLAFDDLGQPIRTASISYGRFFPDTSLGNDIQKAQARTWIGYGENEFTADVVSEKDYQLRKHCQNRYYELTGILPDQDGYYSREGMIAAIPQQAFDYHLHAEGAALNGVVRKRLLAHARVLYLRDSLDEPLPLGQHDTLALPYQSYQLAMTPGLVDHLYQGRVTDDLLREIDYVNWSDPGTEPDDNWWVRSGTALYDDGAVDNFYLPSGSRDVRGNVGHIAYDDYKLVIVETRDSRDNRVRAEINYETLEPQKVLDPNDNWTEVGVDNLGTVVRSVSAGKDGTGDTLERPGRRSSYHLTNWMDHRKPNFVETHDREVHGDPDSRWVTQFQYSDGSGNVVMTKLMAPPGMAKRLLPGGGIETVDTSPSPRWIGSGRSVVNNRGYPVKQYEPYYSDNPDFESADELVAAGIYSLIFYDTAGRVVGRSHSNQTFEKSRFGPWQQMNWDANDTLMVDNPAEDEDIGFFFRGLAQAEYLPTWYQQRVGGDRGSAAERAARATARQQSYNDPNSGQQRHGTPGMTYFDALARPFLGVSDNGQHGHYRTHSIMDIEGNTLLDIDDRGNEVMRSHYMMLPPPDKDTPKAAVVHYSMDSGERWDLPGASGEMRYRWDSRGHKFEHRFDDLNRLVESWVTGEDGPSLVNAAVYCDSSDTDAEQRRAVNLIGTAIEIYDPSGITTVLEMDFKGNEVRSARSFASDVEQTIDWSADPRSQLEDAVYETATVFDALSRPVISTSPHLPGQSPSTVRYEYLPGGALGGAWYHVPGGTETRYLDAVSYNARGQRESIRYANGVTTDYVYADNDNRLQSQRSYRANARDDPIQFLHFTHDAVGNLTEVHDTAQQTLFTGNAAVEAKATWHYDAIYRLIEASGREDGTAGAIGGELASLADTREPQPVSGGIARNYSQFYQYDSVGNILSLQHRAGTQGWTRSYRYETGSNRLEASTLDTDPALPYDEIYRYNEHGSMVSMPHLSHLDWDHSEQLRRVDLGGGGAAWYVYDGTGQRVRKIHRHTASSEEETLYFDGWEVYRRRVNGEIRLERETLHLMDDRNRVALVETKTLEEGQVLEQPETLVRFQLGRNTGLGSIECNDRGEVISYEEYHPYGTTAYHARESELDSSPRRYRYAGREKDEETGFYYMTLRYYCPVLARWTRSDPAGIADGLNVYMYVKGNPVMMEDPGGTGATPAEPFEIKTEHDQVFDAFKEIQQKEGSYFSTASDEELSLWANAYLNQGDPQAWYALSEHLGSSPEIFKGSHLMRAGMARVGAMRAEYAAGNYLAAGANGVVGGLEGFGTAYFGETISETIQKFTFQIALEFAGYKLFKGLGAIATWGLGKIKSYLDEIAGGTMQMVGEAAQVAYSKGSALVRSVDGRGGVEMTASMKAKGIKVIRDSRLAARGSAGTAKAKFVVEAYPVPGGEYLKSLGIARYSVDLTKSVIRLTPDPAQWGITIQHEYSHLVWAYLHPRLAYFAGSSKRFLPGLARFADEFNAYYHEGVGIVNAYHGALRSLRSSHGDVVADQVELFLAAGAAGTLGFAGTLQESAIVTLNLGFLYAML